MAEWVDLWNWKVHGLDVLQTDRRMGPVRWHPRLYIVYSIRMRELPTRQQLLVLQIIIKQSLLRCSAHIWHFIVSLLFGSGAQLLWLRMLLESRGFLFHSEFNTKAFSGLQRDSHQDNCYRCKITDVRPAATKQQQLDVHDFAPIILPRFWFLA